MASPTVAGHFTGTKNGVSPMTVAFTGIAAGETLVLLIHNNSTSGSFITVSSISGVGGTWVQRSTNQLTINAQQTMEVWYNKTFTSTGSQTISINFGASVDAASVIGLRIAGAAASPWDPNVGVPQFAKNQSSSNVLLTDTITTAKADDLLLAWCAKTLGAVTCTPTGFAQVQVVNNAGGADGSYASLDTKSVSATQSAVGVTQTGTQASRQGWYVDALTSDAAAVPRSFVPMIGM